MGTQGFFITGTDTDVGKTVASAWAVLHLNGAYYKPVQSGIDDGMSDNETVRALTDLDDQSFFPSDYNLGAPLSPHEAARLESVRIDMTALRLPSSTRPLIVEGAGGVLVPLNENALMVDLMARFALPLIVVARSGLGTINHTLLTLEALRGRGLAVAGVIMNGGENTANRKAIETYGGTRILGVLPRFDPLSRERLLSLKPIITPNLWDHH